MRNSMRATFAVAIALLLAAGSAWAAKEEKNEYPNGSRKDPKVEMSASTQKDLNKALDLTNDGKYDEAMPLLEKGANDSKASKYAHAMALYGEAQVANGKNDDATAIAKFKEAYALDALPNNQQFQVLYNTAV